MRYVSASFALVLLVLPCAARAQTIAQRGFVDAAFTGFPQDAPNDHVNAVGDLFIREEVFVKPAAWLQFAGGADVRAGTHGQVDASWSRDILDDRGVKRPALSLRRASATYNRGRFTVDAGKQFIRWGKTDIVTPTDHLAPRDYLNVVDTEFLPVTGVRGNVRLGDDNIEAVWVPVFTPSRIPLLDQRWAVIPAAITQTIVPAVPQFPTGPQTGIRWTHAGSRVEFELSFFDGFNHLPNIELANIEPPNIQPPPVAPTPLVIVNRYPSLRSYGADVAIPTKWLTLKAETAYFTSTTAGTDEYVLYVVQVERQTGEWSFVGGYAGDHVTRRQALAPFAPDRGLTEALVGRASYTLDVNRSVSFETAIRQNGDGGFLKAEYSQARGAHWRATLSGSLLRGQPDDFIGQYRLNSHFRLALRYSF
jgi:hypothetical protein